MRQQVRGLPPKAQKGPFWGGRFDRKGSFWVNLVDLGVWGIWGQMGDLGTPPDPETASFELETPVLGV
jgi:hypothetical protein